MKIKPKLRFQWFYVTLCLSSFPQDPLHNLSFSLTVCQHSLLPSSALLLYFPLNLFPCSSFLPCSLPPSLPFLHLSPISASYEVWKMIVCRMKWTEFTGVMAWQNESRPSSPSITTLRRLRLRSVKVLAYWLLVVTTKCLIQCLWHGAWKRRGSCRRWLVVGGRECRQL